MTTGHWSLVLHKKEAIGKTKACHQRIDISRRARIFREENRLFKTICQATRPIKSTQTCNQKRATLRVTLRARNCHARDTLLVEPSLLCAHRRTRAVDSVHPVIAAKKLVFRIDIRKMMTAAHTQTATSLHALHAHPVHHSHGMLTLCTILIQGGKGTYQTEPSAAPARNKRLLLPAFLDHVLPATKSVVPLPELPAQPCPPGGMTVSISSLFKV